MAIPTKPPIKVGKRPGTKPGTRVNGSVENTGSGIPESEIPAGAVGKTAAAGKPTVEMVDDAPAAMRGMDGPLGLVNGVAGAAAMAPLGGFALGGGIAVAKKLNKTDTVSKLEKLKNDWHPVLTEAEQKAKVATPLEHVGNIGFAVSGGVSTYGVIKSFTQQLNSLKHIIADTKGIPVGQVSTTAALFGTIPKSLEGARKHLINEHLVRGAAQLGGFLALAIAVRNKKHANAAAWIAPLAVDQGANMIFGESLLLNYAAFKNSFNAGQPLDEKAYADFVFAASPDLHNRGAVGKIVAAKLGEEYAAKKTDPGVILRAINDGSLLTYVSEKLIPDAEAEHAAKVAEAKAKQAEAKVSKSGAKTGTLDNQHHAEAHAADMVNRIKQDAAQKTEVGPHTAKVLGEKNSATPYIN